MEWRRIRSERFKSTPPNSPHATGSNVAPVSGTAETNSNLDFGKYDPNPVTLSFGELDVKRYVLPQISHELTRVLTNTEVNRSIILHLMKLNIFDWPEINPALFGEYRTEQQRILRLLELLQGRDSDEIRLCLEVLCNLEDNLMLKKLHFRNYFSNMFYGSVKQTRLGASQGPPLPIFE